ISLLKINNNLERIGDFAESIALFVQRSSSEEPLKELFEQLELRAMMDTTLRMLTSARAALVREDSDIASSVLGMDDTIDRINAQAVPIIASYIVSHPQQAEQLLHLYAVIRRIERIGDRTSNIAEDVVFYVDAKELRHNPKKS
ncbi:MAG: PhoU domain-containing protein, partial [Mucinivorans sp.]